MTFPHRWSFGLKTLLLGVALLGILSVVGAHYLDGWFHPQANIMIYGNASISGRDIAIICKAVAESQQVKKKQIASLRIDSSDKAVAIGRSAGTWGGEKIWLENQAGAWKVQRVEPFGE